MSDGEFLQTQYYNWLCEKIMDDTEQEKYGALILQLFVTDFEWFVSNDYNRAYEGLALRDMFCEEELGGTDFLNTFDTGASLLEVIIGLAIRCNYMFDELTVGEWFWQLMKNCGLAKYDDEAYSRGENKGNVDRLINKILKRTYGSSGKGGLFPLKNPPRDQRREELWYQMCVYINENYFME